LLFARVAEYAGSLKSADETVPDINQIEKRASEPPEVKKSGICQEQGPERWAQLVGLLLEQLGVSPVSIFQFHPFHLFWSSLMVILTANIVVFIGIITSIYLCRRAWGVGSAG
jgi:hypothetical protein